MATACLFIGWGRPVPGREKDAFGFLMGEVRPFVRKLQSEGWFESHDFVGITPHGGDLSGFILLKGERAKLDELRRTDEFERISMNLNLRFFGYGVVPGVTGEGIDKVVERNPDLMK
jgi:hypothetical protein